MSRLGSIGDRLEGSFDWLAGLFCLSLLVAVAGCATSSGAQKVNMSGGPTRLSEGPVLDRSEVAELCSDEPFACALGGLMYLRDIGEAESTSTPDEEAHGRARDLLTSGCDAELPVACATLASMYVTGTGVDQDLKEAEKLFRRACSQEGAFGCMGLGRMYETGVSVSRSARQSGALYKKACQLGSAEGCHRLWAWRRSFGTAFGAFTAAARGCAYGYEKSCDALEDQHDISIEEETGRAELVGRLDEACAAGHMSACELLGRHYESGETAARDLDRAAEMYRKACRVDGELRVPRACDRLGALYEQGSGVKKDLNRAASLFEASCDAGWSVGCSHLASMYERGAGVKRDGTRVESLYKTACERGHARACYKVGTLLEPQSDKPGRKALLRSAVFYQIGCSSGSAGACNTLGVIVGYSDHFSVSSTSVTRLFQRACRLDNAEGCYNLAAAFRAGEGVERSASDALKYFRRACDHGMAKACQFIGLPDEADEQSGEEESGSRYEKALRTVMLLENACEEEVARACTRAGSFYREGRGGLEADADRAVEWFKKGCKHGDPDGCAQYAYHLQEGLGVDRNVEAAAKQFGIACKGGSMSACTYLGALYATREVDVTEPARRAAELFKTACEEGELRACVRLARMLRGGWEVTIETPTAIELLRRACEGGREEACAELEEAKADGDDSKDSLAPDGPPK